MGQETLSPFFLVNEVLLPCALFFLIALYLVLMRVHNLATQTLKRGFIAAGEYLFRVGPLRRSAD